MTCHAMHRRSVLTLLGTPAAAWPLAAKAQQGEIKRLGILRSGADADLAANSILAALARLGWIEGRNLRVDYRVTGNNDPEVVRPHAEGLVRAAPDVIFAIAGTATLALQRATRTIPIVFVQI